MRPERTARLSKIRHQVAAYSGPRLRRVIQTFPNPLSDICYHQTHRLLKPKYLKRMERRVNGRIETSFRLIDAIRAHKPLPDNATLLEVGTGDGLIATILLWLQGVDRIVSVDLSRRLNPSLISWQINYCRAHRQTLFEHLRPEREDRLRQLLELRAGSPLRLTRRVMELCNITYIAPADAARLQWPDASIDLHVSSRTLEHIPPETLRQLLRNASRMLKPGGIAAHWIDNADHSSHGNPAISPVNFLRHSEQEWIRLPSPPLLYQNRLRPSEYPPIFEKAGFNVLKLETTIDQRCVNDIKTGAVPLAPQYQAMPVNDLAATKTLIVAAPRPSPLAGNNYEP